MNIVYHILIIKSIRNLTLCDMVPLDPMFQKMYNQYEYKLMDRGEYIWEQQG